MTVVLTVSGFTKEKMKNEDKFPLDLRIHCRFRYGHRHDGDFALMGKNHE